MTCRGVIVCGSRAWTDEDPIRTAIEAIVPGTVVITGGASGADSIAHACAKAAGLPTRVWCADWARYGRAAGPRRNRLMLDDLLGFTERSVRAFRLPGRSPGTDHMIRLARTAGVEVIVEARP